MNQEIFERLVIDKFSGELTPDVAALFDDWLNRQPAAKTEAARLEQTLQLARRALLEGDEPALVRQRFRPVAWLPRMAALAACFAAGLAVEWFALRQPALPPPLAAMATPLADSSFWSRRNWEALAQKSPLSQPLLRWTSPVREPQLRSQL